MSAQYYVVVLSCVDKDFEPLQQDSSDDEETIEKDEREHKNVRFSVLLSICYWPLETVVPGSFALFTSVNNFIVNPNFESLITKICKISIVQ